MVSRAAKVNCTDVLIVLWAWHLVATPGRAKQAKVKSASLVKALLTTHPRGGSSGNERDLFHPTSPSSGSLQCRPDPHPTPNWPPSHPHPAPTQLGHGSCRGWTAFPRVPASFALWQELRFFFSASFSTNDWVQIMGRVVGEGGERGEKTPTVLEFSNKS